MRPDVASFFHRDSSTLTYVVRDPGSSACVIIDPVLDFQPAAAATSTESVDHVLRHVEDEGLEVVWILETHAHADHLSAAPYVKERVGGQIGIGAEICQVQATFKTIFELEPEFAVDGTQFDHLFSDGETFAVGGLGAVVLHTPGHTPACVTYHIEDAVFVGDTLFMPDGGTARADFPGGDANALYRSIQRLLSLPDTHRIFVCHDYQPGGREMRYECSVAEQRENNIHLAGAVTEDAYVATRTKRDATLAVPALLLPSIQVNIRAGRLPPPSEHGTSFLKLPLNRFG